MSLTSSGSEALSPDHQHGFTRDATSSEPSSGACDALHEGLDTYSFAIGIAEPLPFTENSYHNLTTHPWVVTRYLVLNVNQISVNLSTSEVVTPTNRLIPEKGTGEPFIGAKSPARMGRSG